ncbi:MAG TPA: urate hydroxylase PuuD [Caulobacteraceae bacterium]|nr:urate hydroxylase PuuD [Caulobacteraceae bacterium]
MQYDLAAWLNLSLRWLHVIAGIAWIGASFYFVWLDNNLQAPEPSADGVKGELWAVHGGGFYNSRKYIEAPPRMPDTLHWFKWEAYTTWLSGFGLLCLIYYAGAPTYLIDPAKAQLGWAQAVAIGLSFIVGGLLAYEALCRSPIGTRPRLFGLIWFAILTASAWGLTRLFSDRGAFIHVGAMVGTVMVANVLLVIIPNQRKSVAALIAGTPVDPRWGAQGKQRSVHNNYMTLPVIFMMLSTHYPLVTGNSLNWLLLAMISLAGVSIRHFFNLRHQGLFRHEFIFCGVVLMFAASIIATGVGSSVNLPASGPTNFAQAQAIVQTHCIVCHSTTPTHRGFTAPPLGVTFDTPERLRSFAPRIYQMAVATRAMPLGNETGMTDQDRARLGAWIKAGAAGP